MTDKPNEQPIAEKPAVKIEIFAIEPLGCHVR
jgi:hypothetical protein